VSTYNPAKLRNPSPGEETDYLKLRVFQRRVELPPEGVQLQAGTSNTRELKELKEERSTSIIKLALSNRGLELKDEICRIKKINPEVKTQPYCVYGLIMDAM